jgi:hypothetical protein
MIDCYRELKIFCIMSPDIYQMKNYTLLHNLNLRGVAELDVTFSFWLMIIIEGFFWEPKLGMASI